jgi:hypothetical protein
VDFTSTPPDVSLFSLAWLIKSTIFASAATEREVQSEFSIFKTFRRMELGMVADRTDSHYWQ